MLCITSESDVQKGQAKDSEGPTIDSTPKFDCCPICGAPVDRDTLPARMHGVRELLAILPMSEGMGLH